jgi:hypothetical protein
MSGPPGPTYKADSRAVKKNTTRFTESESSLSCSQQPAIATDREPAELNPQPHTLFP